MLALRVTRRPGATGPDAAAVALPPEGLTLGRSDDCSLVLADPLRLVSRQHAEVRADGDAACVRCVSTTAPLYVNGQQVEPGATRVLRPGDQLRIGGFEVTLEGSATPAAPQRARLDQWFDLADAPDPLAPGSPLPNADPASQVANAQRPVLSWETDQRIVRTTVTRQIGAPPTVATTPAHPPWRDPPRAPGPDGAGRMRTAASAALPMPASPLAPASPPVLDPGAGHADAPARRPAAPWPAASVADPVSDRPAPPSAPTPEARDFDATAPTPWQDMASPEAVAPAPAPAPRRLAPAPVMAPPEPAAASRGAASRGTRRSRPAGADLQELAEAFCRGAGIEGELPALTPAWMEHLGALMRATAEGTLALLQSRAVAKRHMRAEGTHITPRHNNPLKFSPDAVEALTRMLRPQPTPGFLDPVAALRDAHRDLLVHQVAMVAGMRAAVFELFSRLGPEAAEAAEGPPHGLGQILPAVRDAALWQRHRQQHAMLLEHLDEDFQAVFGREFLRAYEEQSSRADEVDPDEGPWPGPH